MKSKSVLRSLAGAMFVLLISSAIFAQEARTPLASKERDEILRDALYLTGDTADAEAALQRLNARSRANVVKAVKSLLHEPKSAATIDTILRLVVSLELKEVAPEIQALSEKNSFWRLFHTLNRLHEKDFESGEKFSGRERLSAFYLKRLNDELPAPAKMALVDGLAQMRIAIPKPVFRKLLDDKSYQVREAAAQHLVIAREAYAKEDLVERFKWVFTLKPYQVRLDAMEAFARFPASERQELAGALSAGVCESETNSEVQKACWAIAPKSSKGRGQ